MSVLHRVGITTKWDSSQGGNQAQILLDQPDGTTWTEQSEQPPESLGLFLIGVLDGLTDDGLATILASSYGVVTFVEQYDSETGEMIESGKADVLDDRVATELKFELVAKFPTIEEALKKGGIDIIKDGISVVDVLDALKDEWKLDAVELQEGDIIVGKLGKKPKLQ